MSIATIEFDRCMLDIYRNAMSVVSDYTMINNTQPLLEKLAKCIKGELNEAEKFNLYMEFSELIIALACEESFISELYNKFDQAI